MNQKSGRFANAPFHSGMKKGRSVQVHFLGLAGFLWVPSSAFHSLSPCIVEKLFFPAGVFFIFRNEVLNLISVNPKTLLIDIILLIFLNVFTINFLPFGDGSINAVYCLEIFCMHVCVLAELKSYKCYFLDV